MIWFILAITAPLLWAVVNILDEFLVSKYYDKAAEINTTATPSHVGTLALYPAFFGFIVSLVIIFFRPDVLSVSFHSIVFLLLSGITTIGWIIFYLKALQGSGASSVAPWFQSVPIFGYLFGILFLREHPTAVQIIGSLIIIVGTILATMDFSSGARSRVREIGFMIIASLLVAISGILFKYAALSNDFWLSTFWEYIGVGISGILLIVVYPPYRRDFVEKLRIGKAKILRVNIVSEIFSSSANIMNNFALLLAPVVLVYSVNAIQPLYVFGLSILFTHFWPQLGKESLERRALIAKGIAIILVIIGSILVII